jgi:hypothetical protein
METNLKFKKSKNIVEVILVLPEFVYGMICREGLKKTELELQSMQ